MVWTALALTFALAIVTLLLVRLAKHPDKDLGSVSARWVADHRVDAG
jgi:hypothetical protein